MIIQAKLDPLAAEVAHWRSNHANMVARCAYLQQRPDLPVDRIPAFKAHVHQIDLLSAMLDLSEALRAKLLDEVHALRAAPSRAFEPRSASAECRQYEREAYARGLHAAATQGARRA